MNKKIIAISLSIAALQIASAAKAPAEPVSNGTKSVTSTIVIKKSGVYDFKNVLHVWKGKNWSCSGDKENGPQILRIEASNVTIKNFHFIGDGKTKGSKGLGDPIHIATCGSGQGNQCSGKQSNVVLDGIFGHACEDMITVGTPGNSNITIKNSYLKAGPSKASWDKTVQVNFGKKVNLYDNIFVGGERCIRFKPNTSGEIIGNSFYNCNVALRATSNDADIAPMKNGPVYLVFKDNKFYDVGSQMKNQGSDVHIEK